MRLLPTRGLVVETLPGAHTVLITSKAIRRAAYTDYREEGVRAHRARVNAKYTGLSLTRIPGKRWWHADIYVPSSLRRMGLGTALYLMAIEWGQNAQVEIRSLPGRSTEVERVYNRFRCAGVPWLTLPDGSYRLGTSALRRLDLAAVRRRLETVC